MPAPQTSPILEEMTKAFALDFRPDSEKPQMPELGRDSEACQGKCHRSGFNGSSSVHTTFRAWRAVSQPATPGYLQG